MVPQPVRAVILLFPITGQGETEREEKDEETKKRGQYPIDPALIYITQTVGCKVYENVPED